MRLGDPNMDMDPHIVAHLFYLAGSVCFVVGTLIAMMTP